MAKEDINTANGCDEIGMSNTNIKGLDGAKKTYAVQNKLLRFIIGNDIFESSAFVNMPTELGSISEQGLPRLSRGAQTMQECIWSEGTSWARRPSWYPNRKEL